MLWRTGCVLMDHGCWVCLWKRPVVLVVRGGAMSVSRLLVSGAGFLGRMVLMLLMLLLCLMTIPAV